MKQNAKRKIKRKKSTTKKQKTCFSYSRCTTVINGAAITTRRANNTRTQLSSSLHHHTCQWHITKSSLCTLTSIRSNYTQQNKQQNEKKKNVICKKTSIYQPKKRFSKIEKYSIQLSKLKIIKLNIFSKKIHY